MNDKTFRLKIICFFCEIFVFSPTFLLKKKSRQKKTKLFGTGCCPFLQLKTQKRKVSKRKPPTFLLKKKR